MKLGFYRYNATKVRKRRKLTAAEFDIVLYVSERDSATKYDIQKYIFASHKTITDSLMHLVDEGFLKIIRESKGRAGISRLYRVGVKGRHMISDFYTLMESPVI